MALNAALNAAVALIEGRTDIAREIIRGPGSDVKNVPEIMARLNRAVDRAAAKAMRNTLLNALAIQLPSTIGKKKVESGSFVEEAFYEGVKAVEDIVEKAIADLEG